MPSNIVKREYHRCVSFDLGSLHVTIGLVDTRETVDVGGDDGAA